MFAIGALAKASRIAPMMPKVWLRYGAWCYSHGRTYLEHVAESGGSVELAPHEAQHLAALVTQVSTPPTHPALLSPSGLLGHASALARRN